MERGDVKGPPRLVKDTPSEAQGDGEASVLRQGRLAVCRRREVRPRREGPDRTQTEGPPLKTSTEVRFMTPASVPTLSPGSVFSESPPPNLLLSSVTGLSGKRLDGTPKGSIVFIRRP